MTTIQGGGVTNTHDHEVNVAERRRWNDEQWTATWPRREDLTDVATAPLLDAPAGPRRAAWSWVRTSRSS